MDKFMELRVLLLELAKAVMSAEERTSRLEAILELKAALRVSKKLRQQIHLQVAALENEAIGETIG